VSYRCSRKRQAVEDPLASGGECEARTLSRAQRTGSDRKRSFISASLASQFTRKARSEALPDWCQTLSCDAWAFRSDTGRSIGALMVIEPHTVHILCILGTRKTVHTMHSMCTVWNELGGLRCTNGCIFRLPVESRPRSETVSESRPRLQVTGTTTPFWRRTTIKRQASGSGIR
jgi:hypothetical protein